MPILQQEGSGGSAGLLVSPRSVSQGSCAGRLVLVLRSFSLTGGLARPRCGCSTYLAGCGGSGRLDLYIFVASGLWIADRSHQELVGFELTTFGLVPSLARTQGIRPLHSFGSASLTRSS